MATSTELLRAAEHMRELAGSLSAITSWQTRLAMGSAAHELESEAKRLQAVEAQQDGWPVGASVRVKSEPRGSLSNMSGVVVGSRDDGALLVMCDDGVRRALLRSSLEGRSWPKGWPPFAVLRRAYESLGVEPRPSTKWLESHGYGDEKTIARAVRWEWTEILRFSGPSSP